MAKITRYDGNFKAFGSDATGTERTVFGSTTQTDDLTTNLGAEYQRGWGVLPSGQKPPKQYFNGALFGTSQAVAYLHQAGVAEWNGEQEYHAGSIANRNGQIFVCLTDDHVSASAPETDSTNWRLDDGSVATISALLNRTTVGTVNVLNYHTGLEGGGGVFYWDATKAKTEHNGGTVIDPAKVFPADWNNQTQLTDWFTAGSSGTGCWVRQYDGAVNVKWFGASTNASININNSAFGAATSILQSNDTLFIPTGEYVYSTTIAFDLPVTLIMDKGTILNYTGAGYAIRLGKVGNVRIDLNTWKVKGGKLINGINSVHGIYVTDWTGYVDIDCVYFEDYGKIDGTTYGIFIQYQTWLARVTNCTHTVGAKKSNFLSAHGISSLDNSHDLGSIQLFASYNNCLSTNKGGVGIHTNGAGSQIFANKIEGRTPNVSIGDYAEGTSIHNNYFEALTSAEGISDGACIKYGGDTWHPTYNLSITNNRCHMHGTDWYNSGSFVAPHNEYSTLQGCNISNNNITDIGNGIPTVKINNLVNQNGNICFNNKTPIARTSSSTSVFAFKGEEAQPLILSSIVGTEDGANGRAAKAKLSLDGVVLLSGVLFSENFVDPYTVPSGTVLATLPIGYRPIRTVTTSGIEVVSGSVCTINISINGEITTSLTLTPSNMLGLETISFIL